MALVEARVKTLEQLVALMGRQYQVGQATVGDYLTAESELLEARVELAPDRKTRIDAIVKLVGNLKKTEVLAKERLKSGMAGQAEALRVKAARLKAEVRLARELEKQEAPMEDGSNAGGLE